MKMVLVMAGEHVDQSEWSFQIVVCEAMADGWSCICRETKRYLVCYRIFCQFVNYSSI